MPYTIYALTAPLEHITWKDVQYIGMSVNTAYRFQQHISCSDTTNEGKNKWVRSLLIQDKLPLLHKIEEVETIEQGREREQYWIRYAMSQGAALLNQAITLTENERTERHTRRAIRYAKITSVLAQGTYVKRWSGQWYPPRLLTRYAASPEQHISLVETLRVGFKTQNDSLVSIHDATNKEFDAFIHQYIPILSYGENEWTLEERCDVIEYAMSWGKELDLYDLPPRSAKQKK